MRVQISCSLAVMDVMAVEVQFEWRARPALASLAELCKEACRVKGCRASGKLKSTGWFQISTLKHYNKVPRARGKDRPVSRVELVLVWVCRGQNSLGFPLTAQGTYQED